MYSSLWVFGVLWALVILRLITYVRVVLFNSRWLDPPPQILAVDRIKRKLVFVLATNAVAYKYGCIADKQKTGHYSANPRTNESGQWT